MNVEKNSIRKIRLGNEIIKNRDMECKKICEVVF